MGKSYTEMIQINKKNKLDGLYPATKFLVVILYMTCCFILNHVYVGELKLPLLLIPWFLVYVLLTILSGKFVKCMKGTKSVFWVAFLIFIVQLFLIPGGELLWQWNFLKIYYQGLFKSISLGVMILDVAGIFVWFFQTTENKEIAQCLDEQGVNEKVAYVFISTLKMINVMSKNSKTIMNAQQARGVETEGNLIIRAKAFFPSFVPLMLSSVTGSEERVLTLEARGFSLTGPKTHLFVLKKSGIEKPVILISIAVTVAVILLKVLL